MNKKVNAPLNIFMGDDTLMNKYKNLARNLMLELIERVPKSNDPGKANVSEAARQMGLPQPNLHRLLKGDRKATHETLQKVEAWSKYTIKQLEQPALPGKGNVQALPNLTWVPLLTFEEACNWRRNVDLAESRGAAQLIPTTQHVGPYAYALVVTGDSMEPRFPAGTILVIDPEISARSGDFVIAQIDGSGETVFKQLIVDGSRWQLRSLNSAYLSIPIDKNTLICGKVVKVELSV